MDDITYDQLTIEDAFQRFFYVVPDYQREYVWGEEEVNQLLQDINEHVGASSSEYFIGTIIVSPIKNERNHFDVIDGQQRLTTIFLILCALRVLFKDMDQADLIKGLISIQRTAKKGVKYNRRLQARYENADEVIEKIIEANDDPQIVREKIKISGIPVHGSVEKILNAYDIIYDFLVKNYENEDELEKYWYHLAINVVFIQISTDVSRALKIFETINDRGVGLNPMDLLKNLLFRQVDSGDFNRLKDAWKKVTNPLEKNKEKPLRFLRYFLIANYDTRDDRKDAILREDKIYDWLSKEENAVQVDYKEEKSFEFVRKIILNVEQYINFRKGHGKDDKPNEAMKSLKVLTGRAFSLHYILLLAAANLPKPLFDYFVAQLESFLFYFIFSETQAKELERNLATWANELKNIAENPKNQKSKLNTFVRERFVKDMKKRTPALEDALKRLTFRPSQRYKILYLLARITQHVDMEFSGKKSSLETYTKLHIEHILPNKPKDDLLNAWKKQHPKLSDDEVKDLYDEFKNRLGNLTLLEKPINIVIGNDFYPRKVTEYAKSGNYLTRSLHKTDTVGKKTSVTRINKKLSSFKEWDAETIEKRQQLLVDLAKDIWKIPEIKR